MDPTDPLRLLDPAKEESTETLRDRLKVESTESVEHLRWPLPNGALAGPAGGPPTLLSETGPAFPGGGDPAPANDRLRSSSERIDCNCWHVPIPVASALCQVPPVKFCVRFLSALRNNG